MKSPASWWMTSSSVSEDDIRQSMVALIQRNKVITEGAGALACAALLSGKLDSYIQNRKTVSLISGAISISPGIANYRFC